MNIVLAGGSSRIFNNELADSGPGIQSFSASKINIIFHPFSIDVLYSSFLRKRI